MDFKQIFETIKGVDIGEALEAISNVNEIRKNINKSSDMMKHILKEHMMDVHNISLEEHLKSIDNQLDDVKTRANELIKKIPGVK